jgi:hypothetical protein
VPTKERNSAIYLATSGFLVLDADNGDLRWIAYSCLPKVICLII